MKERNKERKREILIDFNVKDRTKQSEIINKTTLIRAEDGSFNSIFVFSDPQPFTWVWPPVPALNLGLPALAPNFYLLVLVPNSYLSVLAPNLYLPALAPNLYLPALVLKFVFAIPGPNLYLPILPPSVCLPTPMCVYYFSALVPKLCLPTLALAMPRDLYLPVQVKMLLLPQLLQSNLYKTTTLGTTYCAFWCHS